MDASNILKLYKMVKNLLWTCHNIWATHLFQFRTLKTPNASIANRQRGAWKPWKATSRLWMGITTRATKRGQRERLKISLGMSIWDLTFQTTSSIHYTHHWLRPHLTQNSSPFRFDWATTRAAFMWELRWYNMAEKRMKEATFAFQSQVFCLISTSTISILSWWWGKA